MCGWWSRARHRQQRAADLEVFWRALRARADTLDAALVAWQVFLRQPGQEHWRCACGAPIAEVFRSASITVVP